MKVLEKMKHWYRELPDKKRYLEFVSAFLSIGVMLTVIVNNIGNINSRKEQPTFQPPTQTATPQVITVELDKTKEEKDTETTPSPKATVTPEPTPAPKDVCKKEVGPVEIIYPEDGEVVLSDPVCIDILHQREEYCAVVWSYRINGSAWSEYTDKSICLYNLSPGEKKLDLRVKSIASGDEILLKRTFTVAGEDITPTASPESTPSASTN